TSVPESVLVVGGGYIGVELGSALQQLGSHLTIVEAGPSLLPSAPTRLVRSVDKRLRSRGARLLLRSAARITDEHVTVTGPDGSIIPVDPTVTVVSVGRVPNTEDLGLNSAGVTIDDAGYVQVESNMMASTRVAAIGDVVRGPALAHRATAQALVA